jgi:hypothetical protein
MCKRSGGASSCESIMRTPPYQLQCVPFPAMHPLLNACIACYSLPVAAWVTVEAEASWIKPGTLLGNLLGARGKENVEQAAEVVGNAASDSASMVGGAGQAAKEAAASASGAAKDAAAAAKGRAEDTSATVRCLGGGHRWGRGGAAYGVDRSRCVFSNAELGSRLCLRMLQRIGS